MDENLEQLMAADAALPPAEARQRAAELATLQDELRDLLRYAKSEQAEQVIGRELVRLLHRILAIRRRPDLR